MDPHKIETINRIYRQFLKGVAYFKDRFARGLATPPVRRQLAEFEWTVMKPLDESCAKMTAAERRKLEDGHIPF